MKTFFIKMQGLGNDFVVLDSRLQQSPLDPEKIRFLADRRLGVGCDTVVVLEPPKKSAKALVYCSFFNSDGSQSAACGNATRCIAGLLAAETGQSGIVIETAVGELFASVNPDGQVCVDMGVAKLEWQEIPLASSENMLFLPIALGPLNGAVGVNMGNPHAVFFVDDVAAVDLVTLGPQVENHPLFPQKTNVEVVSVLGPDRLRMRVWERGAGITQACGTGACAAVVAAIRRALIAGPSAVVELDGGNLHIEWRKSDGHVLMTGPWAEVYRGDIDYP